jgi:hypothetical protein
MLCCNQLSMAGTGCTQITATQPLCFLCLWVKVFLCKLFPVIIAINTDFRIFFLNSSNFLLNQLIWRKGLKAWSTESIWRGTRATLKYTITWHSIFYLILHFKVSFSFCFFFNWYGRSLMFIPLSYMYSNNGSHPFPPFFVLSFIDNCTVIVKYMFSLFWISFHFLEN